MYLVNRVYSSAEGTCGSGVMDTHTVCTHVSRLQLTQTTPSCDGSINNAC